MKTYPFNEGDTYYTVEDGEIIESTWDDVSDENPNRNLYPTWACAVDSLIKTVSVKGFEEIISAHDSFGDVLSKLDNSNNPYFYASKDKEDFLTVLDKQEELAQCYNLSFVFIQEVGIYVALILLPNIKSMFHNTYT